MWFHCSLGFEHRAETLCTVPVTGHMVPKNTAGDTSAQVQDCWLCTVNPRIHCAHKVSASVETALFTEDKALLPFSQSSACAHQIGLSLDRIGKRFDCKNCHLLDFHKNVKWILTCD